MTQFKFYYWIAGIVFMIAVLVLAQWCDVPLVR
jgi:hypothetical protein